MSTINISEKTKERFRLLKLKLIGDKKKSISEDELMIILLNKFEGKNKK